MSAGKVTLAGQGVAELAPGDYVASAVTPDMVDYLVAWIEDLRDNKRILHVVTETAKTSDGTAGGAIERLDVTFTLDHVTTWHVGEAAGLVPAPTDSVLSNPAPDGVEGVLDHVIDAAQVVNDSVSSATSSVWDAVPWYLKLALAGGLALGAYKLVSDW